MVVMWVLKMVDSSVVLKVGWKAASMETTTADWWGKRLVGKRVERRVVVMVVKMVDC